MASGIRVSDECTSLYEDLKGKHIHKYLTFKISDDRTSIVVDEIGEKGGEADKETWKTLADKLIANGEPRYIVFDFKIEKKDGTGNEKLGFIYWSPDAGAIKLKMLYASSKDALLKKLKGFVTKPVQANDAGDMDYDEVIGKL